MGERAPRELAQFDSTTPHSAPLAATLGWSTEKKKRGDHFERAEGLEEWICEVKHTGAISHSKWLMDSFL